MAGAVTPDAAVKQVDAARRERPAPRASWPAVLAAARPRPAVALVAPVVAMVVALCPGSAAALGARDPFGPPGAVRAGAAPVALPASALTGVRLGPDPAALIDGTWTRPGASVGGARLIEVQRQRVVLRQPDGRLDVLVMPGTAGATLRHQRPERRSDTPPPPDTGNDTAPGLDNDIAGATRPAPPPPLVVKKTLP